jgi:hypothetical protein
MNFYLLLPILTGLTIVSQATLNKMSAGIMGFSTTVFVNGIVFFVGCLALWAGVKVGWIPWTGEMGAIDKNSSEQHRSKPRVRQ